MGTRRLFGFYYKNKFYLVYNSYDSYPKGLGKKLVKEISKAIKDNKIEKWIQQLEKIKIVNPDLPPTTSRSLYRYFN